MTRPAPFRAAMATPLVLRAMAAAILLLSANAFAATQFDISMISPTDAAHTGGAGQRDASLRAFMGPYLSGVATLYNGGAADLGESIWLYDGSTTRILGLSGTDYVNPADGRLVNFSDGLQNNGHLIGRTPRFNAAGEDRGTDIWYFDGTSTVQVNPTGASYAKQDGTRSADWVGRSAEQAFAIGSATRWNAADEFLGNTLFTYDGSTFKEFGLADPVGDRESNSVRAVLDGGLIVGEGSEFDAGGNLLHSAAWIYDRDTDVIQAIAPHTSEFGALLSDSSGRLIGRDPTSPNHLWFYDGTDVSYNIGLNDADHELNFIQVGEFNETGMAASSTPQALGATGCTATTNCGRSAWIYDSATDVTTGIGYVEDTPGTIDHTNSVGMRSSLVDGLNDAGQVLGHSTRYADTGTGSAATRGNTAWLYGNGTHTELGLGLSDPMGTEFHSANGSRDVQPAQGGLTQSGKAWGVQIRYATGNNTALGQAAWLYDGSATVRIGLTGAELTRASDGRQISNIDQVTEDGIAIGRSTRYASTGTTTRGTSLWLYDDTGTRELGPQDAMHTAANDADPTHGTRNGSVRFTEAEGLLAGQSNRYNGSPTTADFGRTGWIYDITTDDYVYFDASVESLGFSMSAVTYVGVDRLVLGTYLLIDEDDNNLGEHAFYWTETDGFLDLGALVVGGLEDAGWFTLANAIRTNGLGWISGGGLLADGTSRGVYLLTPAPVPVPAALWLMGSALGGLVTIGRRKQHAARPPA